MNEDRFDVIIVGGGLAGLAAAYRLAQAGKEVLVIERGCCGSKNMTGGRLYGHSLEKLIPGFAKEAPVERRIVKERISMLTQTGASTVEYSSGSPAEPSKSSYSVLRAKFDRWFASKAVQAGALVVEGILVEDLLTENGKVIGIRSGEDEVYSDVVILAEGVNGLLTQKLGLKKELAPELTAVGVKEVIRLDEQTVSNRFGVAKGEGAAWMFAGDPTAGGLGGGFLYTNKDSISLGIVATISDIGYTETSVPEMVERLKAHPLIQPLIAGGKSIEYSAHLVTEGGYNMIPQLYGDGVLVVGDAAALVINLGFTVRGMDFAIESGRLAAEAVLKAAESGDFSEKGLAVYREMLDDNFVLKDMKQYRKAPQLLELHELFGKYPQLMEEILAALFTVDGSEPQTLIEKTLPALARSGGLITLAKVGMRALEAF